MGGFGPARRFHTASVRTGSWRRFWKRILTHANGNKVPDYKVVTATWALLTLARSVA